MLLLAPLLFQTCLFLVLLETLVVRHLVVVLKCPLMETRCCFCDTLLMETLFLETLLLETLLMETLLLQTLLLETPFLGNLFLLLESLLLETCCSHGNLWLGTL